MGYCITNRKEIEDLLDKQNYVMHIETILIIRFYR